MSTFVLMKILESAPSRYDKGIYLLTWGRLDRAYQRLVSEIQSGQSVLDIGCGTGALTIKAAERGARVRGIDINPELLEIAREKINQSDLNPAPELIEKGVVELRDEITGSYDVVMSGLCFSELSEDELKYTLKETARILKPGGLLLVADEVKPVRFFWRIFNGLVRLPLVVVTYILTQTTTRGVQDLEGKLATAGFTVESVRFSRLKDFMETVAKKPELEE